MNNEQETRSFRLRSGADCSMKRSSDYDDLRLKALENRKSNQEEIKVNVYSEGDENREAGADGPRSRGTENKDKAKKEQACSRRESARAQRAVDGGTRAGLLGSPPIGAY